MKILNIIELLIPFLRFKNGNLGFIPPVLGFTLIELTFIYKQLGCNLTKDYIPKIEADIQTTEEECLFIINQANENISDPLTSLDVIAETIRTMNIKFGEGTVSNSVNEGFDYMIIDATNDEDVFTIYE